MQRIRAVLVAMVLAAVTMTGCDSASDIMTTTDVVEQNGAGGAKWGLARAQFAQQGEYTSAMINRDGGWLQVGDHYLEIRAGAVTGPTRFVMVLREGDNIVVDLHAYKPNGRVVSAFPANKVFLYMNYGSAAPPTTNFAIGYLPNDQAIVPLPTDQYPDFSFVVSNLVHFSTYALIVD
jgi:hypothetical protein